MKNSWLTVTREKWDSFWWDVLGYRLRNLKTSIKNIIYWFPIIWKDRDWDDHYIFEILKHKLKAVSKHHEEKKHYVGWEREVSLMNTAIKLMGYVQNEHYSDVAHEILDKKYGESEWIFTPVPNSTNSRLTFKHSNVENGTYTEAQYDTEYRKLMAEARNKHEKARKLLFRILEERIERYWI